LEITANGSATSRDLGRSHPEERACGRGFANSNGRARVSKDEDGSMPRDAALRAAPRHEGGGERKTGIEIRPMIAGNMQRQRFYRKYVNTEYSLPNTDFIHECGFYAGNYPELTRADLETFKSCLLR
jgi:dTDP-4-amino-4,6-dideoxygalactose transaminase